ncbi:MAG TPA: hypothetical protein VEI96_03465 [Thermodesulfovibrionales bacterium]|nr:hypothetical protein [Thermodesulfovibrionales bacterium]
MNMLGHPLFLFIVSFFGLTLVAWFGALYRERRRLPESTAQEKSDLVIGATLTLLALIIGFTFSMALNRYDMRKNYEEAEANAIGTEYLRADLLPAADAANVRALLVSYTDQRILFYTIHDEQRLRQINGQTAQLQADLWSAVRTKALAQPTPVTALAVAGMNDVLNSQGYTQAAWWNRIPVSAWALMVAMAIFANLMVGFTTKEASGKSKFFWVLPFVVSIAFMLIADIDSPRRGLIRVVPQNLTSLSESLHGQLSSPHP